ncbi:MAG: metallophosphoesterase family protein [Candidatus Aenigmatarchaeota archaeon]
MSEIKEILNEIDKNFGKITFKEFLDLITNIKKQNIVEKIKNNKLFVIGDLHGDYDSLMNLLKFVEDETIIFLGDYGDRGNYQVDVYYTILKLKYEFKDKIILLRGNHEFFEKYIVSPHDLPRQLLARFGNKALEIYQEIKNFWNKLSLAAYNEHFFFVHGGIPIERIKIEDIGKQSISVWNQLLWNDPYEIEGFLPSYRGIGYLFGYNITNRFLEDNKLKLVIRSHEPCNGIKYNHNNKVITVFSMKGYYGNEKASALKIDNDKIKIISI